MLYTSAVDAVCSLISCKIDLASDADGVSCCQLIRRKRGKWPIGDARSVDPIRPPVCVDRLFFHEVAAVGAASSPFFLFENKKQKTMLFNKSLYYVIVDDLLSWNLW